MIPIQGVEFDDPIIEKDRIAKTEDTKSPLESWLLAHTKISLRAFRLALGTIAALCFCAAVVFWILAYYTTSSPIIE